MREKHYFIVNPLAGKKDRTNEIKEMVKATFVKSLDKEYQVYITKAKDDATRFIKSECIKYPLKRLYFYSCGGDGTLNEVVNGVAEFDNAVVSVLPYGSGNDFVRNFNDFDKFFNIESLVNGEIKEVDVIKYNDTYSINICNIGFDAKVAHNMVKFKKLPLVNGEFSYNLSVIYCLLNTLSCKLKITLDDKKTFEDDFLLCVVANGKCYGGGYQSVPLADISDGLIDVCAIRTVSRFKLLSVLGMYKEGKHIDSEELKKYIIYEKCKKVNIESLNDFAVAIDGETHVDRNVEFNICTKKIKFLLPTSEVDSMKNEIKEVQVV